MEVLWIILIVLLVLAFLSVIPTWGYSRAWGWRPGGGLLTLLLIIIIIALLF